MDRFDKKFSKFLPADFKTRLVSDSDFASLISDIVYLTADKALQKSDLKVLPICAHRYADNMPMVSVTLATLSTSIALPKYPEWTLGFEAGDKPRLLDMPILSIQERTKLARLLPQKNPTGRQLHRTLGYQIDKSQDATDKQFQQYAQFHRYYPLFGRVEF